MKTLKMLALAAAVSLSGSAAQAATYLFSYQTSAGVLSGEFNGTLQADNNTILVDSLTDGIIRLNGVAGPSLPVLLTANAFYDVDYNGRPPTVTLDGSFVDFMACADISCMEGVVFDPDTIAFFYPVVVGSDPWGAVNEEFNPSNWAVSAVPEPAAWVLMIVGFAGLGMALRRRPLAAAI